MNKKTIIQASVAKKILKANKDVGKQKQGVPALIVSAAELFVEEMVKKLNADPNSSEIKIENIIKLIQSEPQYDFLISSIPDIQSCSVEEKKKEKKQTDE